MFYRHTFDPQDSQSYLKAWLKTLSIEQSICLLFKVDGPQSRLGAVDYVLVATHSHFIEFNT